MRVLVTGADGFIGREIVEQLKLKNIEVIRLVGPKSGVKFSNIANCYATDISTYENLLKLELLDKIDAVIHSAGLAHQFKEIKKAKFDAVNVEGTKNVAKLAVRLKASQFLLISSTAIYGIKKTKHSSNNNAFDSIIDETEPCQPQTLYAESKLEAERVAIEICEANNIALTILRPAPVIGEANVGNVARLVQAIEKGRFIWVGDGKNLKSLIYKTDVALACVHILTNKKAGTEIFNVAAEPIAMKNFVSEIAKQFDKTIPNFKIPPVLLKIVFQLNAKLLRLKKVNKISETIEKWLSDDIYSARKIKEVYDFQPQYSIVEAITRQINWYKSENLAKPAKK